MTNKIIKEEILIKAFIKAINESRINLEDIPEYYKTKIEEELNK